MKGSGANNTSDRSDVGTDEKRKAIAVNRERFYCNVSRDVLTIENMDSPLHLPNGHSGM